MLNNKRLTLVSECVVNDEKIASFGAIMNIDTMELNLTQRYIDKEACKTYKDTVREDQASFEDFAYALQDILKEKYEEK